jgi:hypothetical protein
METAEVRGSPGWRYATAPVPKRLATGAAIALHAGLHLRRLANPRALWPYALILVGTVLGSLALVRLSLSEPTALVKYFETIVLRAEALCALGLATAAIRNDADAGALGLFLLRPRAPVALPVGRWLAVGLTVTVAGGLMLGGLVLSAAGTTMQAPGPTLLRMLLAVVLDGFAYAAIFLSLACWFKSAAAAGLAWFGVADLVLPPLSDAVARFSPSHHLQLMVEGVYPPATDLMEMVKGLGKAPVALPPDPWNAWLVPVECLALLLLTALPLGLAMWRMRRQPPA